MVQTLNKGHGDMTLKVMLGWAKQRLKKKVDKTLQIVSAKPATPSKSKT